MANAAASTEPYISYGIQSLSCFLDTLLECFKSYFDRHKDFQSYLSTFIDQLAAADVGDLDPSGLEAMLEGFDLRQEMEAIPDNVDGIRQALSLTREQVRLHSPVAVSNCHVHIWLVLFLWPFAFIQMRAWLVSHHLEGSFGRCTTDLWQTLLSLSGLLTEHWNMCNRAPIATLYGAKETCFHHGDVLVPLPDDLAAVATTQIILTIDPTMLAAGAELLPSWLSDAFAADGLFVQCLNNDIRAGRMCPVPGCSDHLQCHNHYLLSAPSLLVIDAQPLLAMHRHAVWPLHVLAY